MPRNINERKEPILDHYLLASVNQANGQPNSSGRYKTLIATDHKTYDEAIETRNALYRSAYHLDCGLDVDIKQQQDGTYHVIFAAVQRGFRSDRSRGYWDGLEIWKRHKREEKYGY